MSGPAHPLAALWAGLVEALDRDLAGQERQEDASELAARLSRFRQESAAVSDLTPPTSTGG